MTQLDEDEKKVKELIDAVDAALSEQELYIVSHVAAYMAALMKQKVGATFLALVQTYEDEMAKAKYTKPEFDA